MKKTMIKVLSIALAAILFPVGIAQAQDGKELFENVCSTCHKIDENSTGPKLKGSRQKWVDAEEGELLYEWVKNPLQLKNSGTSKMAAAIWDYSPTNMNAQQVTNEQIDAIFDYVDNWTPPVVDPVAPATDGVVVVTKVENYKQNEKYFYWLVATMLALLIAIIVMASSIKSFLQTDFFKKRMKEAYERDHGNTGKMLGLAILLASTLVPAATFAQSGDIGADEVLFKITSSELIIVGVIDILLLFVLFYQVRLFKSLYKLTRTPEQAATVEEEGVTAKKINKILTDAVDIEDEASILLDHEYDGIQELDNNLPPWWVWGFWATIIFAVVYLLNYHVLGTSHLQIAEYEAEVAQAEIEIAEYRSKMAMNVDEFNVTLMAGESDLNAGKAIYEKNCQSCHMADGRGDIGPNLTDDYWIYGNDIASVFKTIKYGAPNGMPDHEKKLNPIELQQVSSFILSFKYVEGKEPEGSKMSKVDSLAESDEIPEEEKEKE
jgi:cytochrome c oxidase cbb3-type subunit III